MNHHIARIAIVALASVAVTATPAQGQDAHRRHCGVDYNHSAHHYTSRSHHHFCPGGGSGHNHGHSHVATTRRVVVSDPTLAAVQTKLMELGLYHPEHARVDGIYGKETAGAIRAFQRTNGMTQHGQVDGALLQGLGLAAPGGVGQPGLAPVAASPANDTGILTVAEAAQVLKAAERDVHALLESGELKGRKIGPNWRVTRQAIDDYLQGDAPANQ